MIKPLLHLRQTRYTRLLAYVGQQENSHRNQEDQHQLYYCYSQMLPYTRIQERLVDYKNLCQFQANYTTMLLLYQTYFFLIALFQ